MLKNHLQIKNLSFIINGTAILHDITFNVNRGDMVAVIGPNGSGKTTLLKNIIGIYKPTSGQILIDNNPPGQIKNTIGYVPQKFEFDRSIPITVFEFMALEKCDQATHGCQNISRVLNEVGLKDIENKKLGLLSGGQFQRVMIARALLHEKEILIFDEPSTGIDIAGEHTVYDLISEINKKRHTTCIIVSHELNIVSKYAKKVLCLNKKMLCYGTPETVITPQNLKELYGIGAGLYHSHQH